MLVTLALCVRDKDCVDVGETERVSVALALPLALPVPVGDGLLVDVSVTDGVDVPDTVVLEL